MPDTIPQHFTTEFSTNWIHRTQQMKSRLDEYVEEDSFTGERKRYDRIGAKTSRERTERNGVTPIGNADMDLRWAVNRHYDVPATLLDPSDAQNLGTLVLPTSDIVKSYALAYGRDKDDVAWKAALDDTLTGETGTTTFALPAGQKIAAGGTGLTIAKLRQANFLLEDADLEDDQSRVMCVTAKQLQDLLATTEVTSNDYNTVRALVDGKVDTFMGFKFKKIKRLRLASTTRTCVAWVKGAIKRTKGTMWSKIDLRPDRSYATQIYAQWDLGATRIYDEGVVQIDCVES